VDQTHLPPAVFVNSSNSEICILGIKYPYYSSLAQHHRSSRQNLSLLGTGDNASSPAPPPPPPKRLVLRRAMTPHHDKENLFQRTRRHRAGFQVQEATISLERGVDRPDSTAASTAAWPTSVRDHNETGITVVIIAIRSS